MVGVLLKAGELLCGDKEEGELLKSYSVSFFSQKEVYANIYARSLGKRVECAQSNMSTINGNKTGLQIKIDRELVKNYPMHLNEFKSCRSEELHLTGLKELADVLSETLSNYL